MTDTRPRDPVTGEARLRFDSSKSASMRRAQKDQGRMKAKDDLTRAIYEAEMELAKRSGGVDRIRDGSLASRIKTNKEGKLFFRADDTKEAHELQLKDGRLYVKGPGGKVQDFGDFVRLLE